MAPAENPNPCLISSKYAVIIDNPVNIACTTYNSGDKNINENSIGSVTPVKNAVNAILPKNPPTAAFRCFFAVKYIAKQAPGKPNIIIGKNPARKYPALGSPFKKRLISPFQTCPAASVKDPKSNQIKKLNT